MTKEAAKEIIKDLVKRTIQRIPSVYEKDLPPMELLCRTLHHRRNNLDKKPGKKIR